MKRAAFLDRDGVINRDVGYVHRWDEFEFLAGVFDAMRRLRAAGYHLVIVTNQSGLARGLFDEAQYGELTGRMLDELARQGIAVEAVYHCPHHPAGTVERWAMDCDCRKPAPGMILRAAAEHGLSLADSFMVGDKLSDIGAARAAGVGRAFLVRSENPECPGDDKVAADGVFASLADCVDALGRA